MESGCLFDIAVVVVTFNAESYIEQCLQSIFTHLPAGYLSTIIVVDNSSADKTLELVCKLKEKGKSLKIVALEENIGFGPANNLAMNVVKARYYVLVNMDAWFIADSIGAAIQTMENSPSIAVCGLPLVFPNGDPQTYAYGFSSWKKWLLQILGIRTLVSRALFIPGVARCISKMPFGKTFVLSQKRHRFDFGSISPAEFDSNLQDVDWVCGAAMILEGGFVKSSRGFDQNIFLYGEDEDLCITAHDLGRRVVVIDVPPLVHVFGWGKNQFNSKVARLKYTSLKYFISKNITKTFDRLLMRLLLPLYVYGWRRLYMAIGAEVEKG
ncbi:MAG: hypothetical protein BA869_06095 [Desulfuromonadales bacterium C00003107]|jgi:GT2 family glycosyltransferase|nr:MAG: hypothetical protein BA869_06095 [Desulfuromonadales bacterium C00003107]